VILSAEKQTQKANSTIHMSGGELDAASVNENFYAAIDPLSDKIDRGLIKKKKKKIINLELRSLTPS